MSFWRGREGYRGEVREELQFHLDMRAAELQASGAEPGEARRLALESFGDPKGVEFEILEMKEHRRNVRPLGEILGSFAQDLRYAGRFLRRDLVFTGAAVATLALGIGANTAMFSLLSATLLREPGVRDPASLVAVYTTSRQGAPRSSTSYPDYVDYANVGTLSDLAATERLQMSVSEDDAGPTLMPVEMVTGNYFSLLGVPMETGRAVQPEDDVRGGGAPVAVLPYRVWRDRFGADPDIVGRGIRLNGQPVEVIGVASRSFTGLVLGEDTGAWIPLQTGAALAGLPDEALDVRGNRWMGRLVGRLSSGSTAESARAGLLGLSDRLREADPEARGPRSVTIDPLGRYLAPLGAETSLPRFVWLLVGVVGSTLLLACANLAGLQLTRASARRAEIGVRIAIGAGRGRLIRQLLTESLLLAGVGGALGLLVALSLLGALGTYELPGGLAFSSLPTGLDARLLAAAVSFSACATILFGIVPALQSTRLEVAALHRGGAAGARRGAGRARRGLVAVQVGLCFLLLAGSGLFIRSLRSALGTELGFESRGIAVGIFDLAVLGYEGDATAGLAEELRQQIEGLPAVESAALANVLPIAGGGFTAMFAAVDGYQAASPDEIRVERVFTTPGYFETLGIPLLAGRDLGRQDSRDSDPVAVISRSMAERYWPDGNALGGTFSSASPTGMSDPVQVVGIVGDVHWRAISEEPTNFAFLPMAQHAESVRPLAIAVRTAGEPEPILPLIREAAEGLEPDLSFQLLSVMDTEIGQVLMPQRVGSVFLSGFGVLALVLATVGIFGLISYTVREQRRAIALRMALGAGRGKVIGEVAREVVLPAGAGLTLGLAASLVLDDALATFLYGVSPGDLATYSAAGGVLALAVLFSTLLPARQAARVDAMQVLRSE